VSDENYVPVWYNKNTLNNTIINNINKSKKYSLFLGNNLNNDNINIFPNYYPKTIININTLERFDFVLLNDSKNNINNFNLYNAIQTIDNNILIPSNSNGFYLQIQDYNYKIIWEFFANLFLTQTAINNNNFDISAIDIHPINSNIIISIQNTNALICINYYSKNINWIYDPTNTFQNFLIPSYDVIFLTATNLPIKNLLIIYQ
jgi:hypothetical protein